MSSRAIRRWSALVLAIILLLSILAQERARVLFLDFVGWVRDLGFAGALVYGMAYVLATVALLPGLVLTLGAGFLYGPVWGAMLVMVFSLVGAAAAFVLARSWWRPWVLRKLQGRRALLLLDERMASEGWNIVLLLRLSPLVPFSILNYLLGVTRLPLRSYLSASALGMIPGILLYSYLGSAIASVGQLSSYAAGMRSWDSIAFALGLLATVLSTLLISRWARRALQALNMTVTALEA